MKYDERQSAPKKRPKYRPETDREYERRVNKEIDKTNHSGHSIEAAEIRIANNMDGRKKVRSKTRKKPDIARTSKYQHSNTVSRAAMKIEGML